jgi:hypothetical protein
MHDMPWLSHSSTLHGKHFFFNSQQIKKNSGRTPRRLITISPSDGRWHGKWTCDYLLSLRDLRLQDLVEGEQHKDAGVFVQLCVHKVFGKGLFARFVSLIFSQIIYNVLRLQMERKARCVINWMLFSFLELQTICWFDCTLLVYASCWLIENFLVEFCCFFVKVFSHYTPASETSGIWHWTWYAGERNEMTQPIWWRC